MKIFIVSSIIIAIGSALIIGFLSAFVIIGINEGIEQMHLNNLMIIYDIKE